MSKKTIGLAVALRITSAAQIVLAFLYYNNLQNSLFNIDRQGNLVESSLVALYLSSWIT